MKKLFFLILFACMAFVLNVQANVNHIKFIFQKEKFLHVITIKDSIPQDTANTKPVFNTSSIDPLTFKGDPFIRNPEGNTGNFISQDGSIKGSFNYQGEAYPTIHFEATQADRHNYGGDYLGYSLSEDKATGRKIGAYVKRDDGVLFVFQPTALPGIFNITEITSVPKGLFNGSDTYKTYYSGEKAPATKSTPNPNLATNFNNAPAGTKSAADTLGTATIIDSSSAGIFIEITRSNNTTLVKVIKLDKHPNANVYLSTKQVKLANMPTPTYVLYNIGQNGNYSPSPVPANIVSAYAKYSTTPWPGTSNQ